MIARIGYLIMGILVLFVPGFLLSFLLFSGEKNLGFWKRMITSIGLSAFIDMLIITILAQPLLSAMRFIPVVGSIGIFCVACGVLLFLKKDSLETFLNFWNRIRRSP